MLEENQNAGKRMLQADTSDLRSWANSMIDFQNQAREQQMAKFNMERENDLKKVYTSGLSTTNHGVSQDCNRAFKIGLIAQGIRDYFAKPENGGIDYSNIPDVDLVDSYKSSNPDSEKAIWQFVLDDSQICDPNPTYQEMGLYTPEETQETKELEEKENESGVLTNIAGGITDSILGLPKFSGKIGADLGAESIKLFGGDEERANAAAEEIKSYIDKISFGDENSRWYRVPKTTSDLVLAYLLGKGIFPEVTIGNLNAGTKSLLGAGEGMLDMTLYDLISDSELPSKGDLNLGMGLGALIPRIGPAYKGVKGLIKSGAKKEVEKTIGRFTKLTESQQDKFLKEFGEPFTEWMNSKGLSTYDDVIKYWKEISSRKRTGLSAIKGKYQSPEVEDVLNEVVEYARRTKDPNLPKLEGWLKEYQNGGLDMATIDEVKQYFEFKRNFAYDENLASEIRDTLTNMDTALREWQRKVAAENGLDILADLNEEKRVLYFLKEKAKDMTKIGKPGMSFKDFFVALSTGNVKGAMSYLFTKEILSSPTFDKYWLKIMKKLMNSPTIDDLVVDFEKIQEIQDEKAFLKWLEENGIQDEALPNAGGTTNIAGTRPTILEEGESFVSSPTGETRARRENNGRNGIDFIK